MRYKIFLLLIIVGFLSCNKKEEAKAKTVVETKDTLNPEIYDYEETESEEILLKQLEFPKTGKSVEDFVLQSCEIKMKAEGFLNDDSLTDIVIVLQNENDRTDDRAVLVLLQEETGGYKLQDLSWEAVGPEYLENGYRIYDNEEISIDKERQLHITLQAIGPPGSRETIYKYINNELTLVKMGTFNAGAGSHLSSEYDFIAGKVDHEVTNTMHDSMPSRHETKKFNLKRPPLFGSDNPDEVREKLPAGDW
ncbi:hypothetical protein ACFSJW_12130 [Flavobacterium artemisiae]|uniref:Lipoprotein n=1 Tax=Flavobacterium artemisiae TaxID=2126556 RepID=A0ABW4HDY9_9FLAO